MEFELSNQFYLGPSESHAKALRNEVDPKGPDSAENSPLVTPNTKFSATQPSSNSSRPTNTGIMRLLPLMKQLELILRQKSLQLLFQNDTTIQEEDEDPSLPINSSIKTVPLNTLPEPASTTPGPQDSAMLAELSLPKPQSASIFSNQDALALEASVASYRTLKLQISDAMTSVSSRSSSQNTLRLKTNEEDNEKNHSDSPQKTLVSQLPSGAIQAASKNQKSQILAPEASKSDLDPELQPAMTSGASVDDISQGTAKISEYPAVASVSSGQSTATELPDPTVRSILPERSLKVARTPSSNPPIKETTESNPESPRVESLSVTNQPGAPKTASDPAEKPVIRPKSDEKQYEPYVPKSMIPDHIPRIQPPLARNSLTASRTPDISNTNTASKNGQTLPNDSEKDKRVVTPKTQSTSQFSTPRTPSLSHRRLLSVYSTGSTPKQTPRSTTSHKRSSTLGDISTLGQQQHENPNKKGFSFKLLFKKSKNHSLHDINDFVKRTEPKQRRKSTSIPNFEKPEENSIQQDQERSAKKHNNKRDSAFLGVFKKSRSLEKKPAELDFHTTPNNLEVPSVAAKDSSTEDSHSISYNTQESVRTHVRVPSTPSTDTPQTQRATNESSATTYNSTSSYHKPPPVKLQANHIREVNDSDYENNSILHYNDLDYDSLNGLVSHPAHIIVNGRVDNEILLDPADKDRLETPRVRDSMLLPDLAFGSPFRIDLQPQLSNKDRGPGNNPLAGETLFPKLLSAQEVESIVSLERLRSMRSHKLKRNSFINYSGSNENIVHGEDRYEPNSARRSSSILKNSESSRSLQIDEVMGDHSVEESGILESLAASNLRDKGTIEQVLLSSEKKGVPDSANDSEHDGFSFDGDFDDFIEFTDFIEPAQLNFSPVESVTSFEAVAQPSKQEEVIAEPLSAPFSPVTAEQSPILTNKLVPTPTAALFAEAKPQSPSSKATEHSKLGQSVPKADTFSPKLRISHPSSSLKSHSPLSYSSDRDLVLQMSPELTRSPLPETKVTPEATSLPIFESAFRENKPTVVNGKSTHNNRPISMSFKGLDSRSFQGKLAMHDMRNLSSHQSFNISFDDSEASGNIGNGFGSSDDEVDDDLFDESSDFVDSPIESTRREPSTAAQKFNLMPPQFNRLPQNSNLSPRSLSSFISRNFKKPLSPKMKAGVKFSSRIVLYDTYSGDEYDRHPEIATCNQLTPILAQQIREELNNLKATMEVHRLLIGNTHFI